jgi:hypothetical protein
MRYFFLWICLCTQLSLHGQVSEGFDDGNFTASPSWIGDDSVFTVVSVSGNMRLRSNKLLTNSSYYLSTASSVFTDAQWEFFVNLQFNTSSANYVDVFLTATEANLFSSTLSGYFVRIGGTADEISLYRKQSGTNTKIIDGTDGITNVSNSNLKIKVVRTALGDWTLQRDNSGSGNSYTTEGQINDVLVNGSAFFGFAITHSTLSFIQKHFFDDIYVGPIIYDLTPPELTSASAISSTQLDVLFNEPLDPATAENALNYTLNPSLPISGAVLDVTNPALVHLTTASALTNGGFYTLNATGIADEALNTSGAQSTSFTYLFAETPVAGDVIINEFMADPSPSVGQPELEYIEIHNVSTKYFNLNGWKVGDGPTMGSIQNDWLIPGGYKVLCATSSTGSFAQSVAVSSFPSLNNAGDSIILKDNTGSIIDALYFTDSWYNDDAKAAGGFSLERINPQDPCSAADNWTASAASNGGTPGVQNSVFDNSPDLLAPDIIELTATAPNLLEIRFSENLDSLSLVNTGIITSPTLSVLTRFITGTYADAMTLQFNENIVPGTVYTILLSSLSDCWMNSADRNGQFILPDEPISGEVILNEILFDPITGGSDWIEVFNNSNKVFDLKGWEIANYDNDTIDNNKVIETHFFLLPGMYAVIGEDSAFVLSQYPFAVPGSFVFSDLPSLNVDSSTVYLLYGNEQIDKVSYTDDWHFKLLDVTDGVSLERIDPSGGSSDQFNWHSAAEAVGFATPGAKNSQYYPAIQNGSFSFSSATVSPDNDGFEDILQVAYEMSEAGLLGTFTIYDDRGRKIRELFANELLGSSGNFNWDGVTDDNVKASIGTYVAVFEAFSLEGGMLFTGRKAFTVAGRL